MCHTSFSHVCHTISHFRTSVLLQSDSALSLQSNTLPLKCATLVCCTFSLVTILYLCMIKNYNYKLHTIAHSFAIEVLITHFLHCSYEPVCEPGVQQREHKVKGSRKSFLLNPDLRVLVLMLPHISCSPPFLLKLKHLNVDNLQQLVYQGRLLVPLCQLLIMGTSCRRSRETT